MSQILKEKLYNSPYTIDITPGLINSLVEYCAIFETKGVEALNTPTLGVHLIYFTDIDRNMLFDLFGLDEDYLTDVIDLVPGIDPSWNVARDEYNHLIIWLIHLIYTNKKLNKDQKELGIFILLKMLHYKFFTSIVVNSYKHGADPNVMDFVISQLSNKYDIIQYKTWKGVIESRCKDILQEGSTHHDTFLNYIEDKDILYILSDIQTNLRTKIVLINRLYYDEKEKGNFIDSYSTTNTIDGEKTIVAQTNIFDIMIEGMISQVQTPARFIDYELIQVLCKKFQYVSEEMLRHVLLIFAETAATQSQSNDLFKQIVDKKSENKDVTYVGIGLIIRELIQKTYRLCILQKVNMNSKSDILIKTLNLYTSSRISDDDILVIKRSLLKFVLDCKKSTRDATNSSLVIAIVLYTMIKSFEFLK